MNKIIVSKTVKPPLPVFAHDVERGLDPWHRSAFPTHLAHGAPDQGEVRKEGWFFIDGAGNQVGFVADGTEIEVKDGELDRDR